MGRVSRILGVDPGSRVTGFGLIDSNGAHTLHVASGAIRLQTAPLANRLGAILRELESIIETFRPEIMAIEAVFVARNAASALILGHARGAAICSAVLHRLEVAEYSARAVKQALVGTGGADKPQVQHMVQRLLNLKQAPTPDAADALACAICHAHTAQTLAHTRLTEMPLTRNRKVDTRRATAAQRLTARRAGR